MDQDQFTFGRTARRVLAGQEGLSPTQDVALLTRPRRLDLTTFERMLGVPVEGFIGTDQLTRWQAIDLDYDSGRLHLLEGTPEAPAGSVALSMNTPFHLEAQLDGHARRSVFVDLGSRFNIELSATRDPPTYDVEVPSMGGDLTLRISTGHTIAVHGPNGGAHVSHDMTWAHGAPAPMPMLGQAWLVHHQTRFSFAGRTAYVSARTTPVAPWEDLRAQDAYPDFEVRLEPTDVDLEDRTFRVRARAGRPLGRGLSATAAYRVHGAPIPPGPEGINALITTLHGAPGTSVTLVGPDGPFEVVRTPLW